MKTLLDKSVFVTAILSLKYHTTFKDYKIVMSKVNCTLLLYESDKIKTLIDYTDIFL